MGKKIGTGPQVDAEKWVEGKLVVGFLISVDVLPKCDSRKVTLEVDNGQLVAVWETGALARQLSQMTVGQFYRIKCLGKTIDVEGTNEKTGAAFKGKAWAFDVEEADGQVEVAKWQAEYRAYVAGGGK